MYDHSQPAHCSLRPLQSRNLIGHARILAWGQLECGSIPKPLLLVPKMVGILHITQPLQWCLAVPAATHAKRVLLLTKETVVVKHALAMRLTTYLHVQ